MAFNLTYSVLMVLDLDHGASKWSWLSHHIY